LARRPHLGLRRLEGELERRKHGFGKAPDRDHVEHGNRILNKVAEIVGLNAQRPDYADDPSIILRINTASFLSEDALAAADLQILSQTGSETIVVYAPDARLSALTERATAYVGPIPADQRSAVHAGFFNAIDDVVLLSPEEKIGPGLSAAGVYDVAAIAALPYGLYDVTLFDPENGLDQIYLNRLQVHVDGHGGELLSPYRGSGLFLARIRADGNCLATVAGLREVSSVDVPPRVELSAPNPSQWNIGNVPPVIPPPENAVRIGIVDSGIVGGHPMLAPAIVGEFGVPERLGTDDVRGHGTAVAGIAVFGSIEQQLGSPALVARFQIVSAKVVDGHGLFDDEETVPAIVDRAIRRLHDDFGCRVINISLGDAAHHIGDRPSPWAALLDNLARELDIVVVISAGNIPSPSEPLRTGGLARYPAYMLEQESRLLEPASSVTSLVVGSIAHSNGLQHEDVDLAALVPITASNEPSPFSCCGPGYDGAIKPDLVEYGGTAIWEGYNQLLNANRDSCGILTLNANYTQRLLGYRHGTSFAAPAAAFKAASVLEALPGASANLVRALMGLSAKHPEPLLARTDVFGPREHLRFAGYGVTHVDDAIESDDTRPVLLTEDSLPPDMFAVYEVPIPEEFQTVRGTRGIRVSLAFDPPTRSSRRDYLGIRMGFHLARGVGEQDVFDNFRRWEREDRDQYGEPFKIDGSSWQCKMEPIATLRESGTLQVGYFSARQDISHYGDRYYLVVRCQGGWASSQVERQRFAVAVELSHSADLNLYQEVAVSIQA
jgi:subtilisin family serine protease